MDTSKSSIWPGLILIIIGSILLLYKLDIFDFGWYQIYPVIMMGLGILFFTSIAGKSQKGAVFPGTILFLLGLFFFLRNYEIVPYDYVRHVGPVVLIIVGLAFFAVFLTKPSDWGALIPSAVLVVVGSSLLLREFHVIHWNVWDVITMYWPILLIVIGAGIIFRSFGRQR